MSVYPFLLEPEGVKENPYANTATNSVVTGRIQTFKFKNFIKVGSCFNI